MPKSILDHSRSLAAILTGLRLLREMLRADDLADFPSLADILTDGGTLPIPTEGEIGELAEYINCDPLPPPGEA